MITLVLIVAFAPAPFPKETEAQRELKKLEGSWERLPQFPARGNYKVVITGDVMLYTGRTKDDILEYKIVLNLKKRPLHFDSKGVRGRAKGQYYYGVYKIEHGHLILCSHTNQDCRPTDFDDTKPGVLREIFQRTKEK